MVIVTDIDRIGDAEADALPLYVGISRATERLVVLANRTTRDAMVKRLTKGDIYSTTSPDETLASRRPYGGSCSVPRRPGPPLETHGNLTFEQRENSYGPWTVAATGEEILDRATPARAAVWRRRAVPRALSVQPMTTQMLLADSNVAVPERNLVPAQAVQPATEGQLGEDAQDLRHCWRDKARFEDLNLRTHRTSTSPSDNNDRGRQSAIAVTFLARLRDGGTVSARVSAGGRYYPLTVTVAGSAPDLAGRGTGLNCTLHSTLLICDLTFAR